VQEAVQLLRASLPVTIESGRTCPRLPCRSVRYSADAQVIMNLGTNAAHAMQSGKGILAIDVEPVVPDRIMMERHPQVKPGHQVRLTVRDTGSGITPEVMARIFEPFFTTKAPDEGTGLGLAMVHGIVEDHKGAIVITSAVGQGTTVAIYFPPAVRQGDSTPPTADDTSSPMAPFGRGRKVMIVDDRRGCPATRV